MPRPAPRYASGPLLVASLVLLGGGACGGAAEGPQHPAAKPTTPPPVAAPIALGPGEVVELEGGASGFSAELAVRSGDERFVIVLASTTLGNAEAPVGYRLARRATTAGRSSARDGCSIDGARWRKASPAPVADPPAPTGAGGPQVGSVRTFSFRASGGTERVATRAVATGTRSITWADTTPEHPATLDAAFAAEFQGDFERQILPRARAVFGVESDVDGDGRISLFFTPLTSAGGVAFFSGCDLSPRSACPGSNEGEVLYLTPPNAIRPPYNTPRAVKEILAHELEHLIHHHRKVLRNKLPEDPDAAYMLEGFGALAQDVVGFQAGNLYVTKAGLEEIDDFSLSDVLREGAVYAKDRDGALRGGAYLFVRWLYDRGGGDRVAADGRIEDLGGPTLIRSLLDAPQSVAAELPRQSGAPMSDILVDFYTALALGGGSTRPAKNACFTYLPVATDPVTGRQRGADLFASFHGMQMSGPAIQDADRADGRLRPGGVEYLSLDARAGEDRLPFSISVEPGAAPRLRVVRIR